MRGDSHHRRLSIKASVPLDDSLIQRYYKPYIEKHINLINKLSDTTLLGELRNFYGFNPADIKEIEDSSRCMITTFPMELKRLYGYSGLRAESIDCKNGSKFTPYVMKVIAYAEKPRNPIYEAAENGGEIYNTRIQFDIGLDRSAEIKKINYRLYFNKPEARHFDQSLGAFPTPTQFSNVSNELKKALKKIHGFNTTVESIFEQRKTLAAFEDTFRITRDSLKYAVIKVSLYFSSQKTMIKNWLWYTGGKPSLNPFLSDAIAADIKPLKDKINSAVRDSVKIDLDIKAAQQKYDYYKETMKSNIKDKPTIAEAMGIVIVSADKAINEIKDIQLKQYKANSYLDSLRKLYKQKTDSVIDDAKASIEFKKKNIFLYDGYIFPGSGNFGTRVDQYVYCRNYDRLQELEPFQRMPTSYDESAKVYLLIENESKKNKFKYSITKINNEQSPFTIVVGGAIDELSKVALTKAIYNADSLKKNLGINKEGGDEEVERIRPDSTEIYVGQINKYAIQLKNFSQRLTSPPQIPIGFENDDNPIFWTDYHLANFPDTTKWSYVYRQIITQSNRVKGIKSKAITNGQNSSSSNTAIASKTSDTSLGKNDSLKEPITTTGDTIKFRVNKLFRVLPSVGLAYSNADSPEVSLNPDGSFKDATYFSGSALMLGLKIYALGAVPLNDSKFIISRGRRPQIDYRKIHLIGGVNAFKPLKQFYLGAGVDLWSGLSINCGYYLINKTQQKLVNQKIESKNYIDYQNFYFSVNIDISLAVKLINLFAKK